jgi:hypothetical protein
MRDGLQRRMKKSGAETVVGARRLRVGATAKGVFDGAAPRRETINAYSRYPQDPGRTDFINLWLHRGSHYRSKRKLRVLSDKY